MGCAPPAAAGGPQALVENSPRSISPLGMSRALPRARSVVTLLGHTGAGTGHAAPAVKLLPVTDFTGSAESSAPSSELFPVAPAAPEAVSRFAGTLHQPSSVVQRQACAPRVDSQTTRG